MATYEIFLSSEMKSLFRYDHLTRQRWDALVLQLKKAGYEYLEARALLDRPIAHEFMTWCAGLKRPPKWGCQYYYSLGADTCFFIQRRY